MIKRRKPLKRTPIKRKRTKRAGADPKYLAWIHTLPCAVRPCYFLIDFPLMYHIEAHHAGDHGFAQRAPDRTAIPLCNFHHREGRSSAHALGKQFWEFHFINRDELIAKLNAHYDGLAQVRK
jgi:hypothetical protein